MTGCALVQTFLLALSSAYGKKNQVGEQEVEIHPSPTQSTACILFCSSVCGMLCKSQRENPVHKDIKGNAGDQDGFLLSIPYSPTLECCA